MLSLADAWVRVRWRIDGVSKLVLPPFAGRGRADNLWQTTCFEMFVQPAGSEGYCEFNLSPSERWAAYEFSARREGMREHAIRREPDCTMRSGHSMAIFDAALPRENVPEPPVAIGLCAVIEEEGGHKSYWAMTHQSAQPDFHDPACFAAKLGPRKAA